MNTLLTMLNPVAILIAGLIIAILVVAIAITLVLRKRYEEIMQEVAVVREGGRDHIANPVLKQIISEYRSAAAVNRDQVNTQAIVEKHFDFQLPRFKQGERFVKNSISLMIILGLLGTFYGLTLSIGRLVSLLNTAEGVDMLVNVDSIVSGLINSVQGMSVAFITSLIGISGAVIMTLFGIVCSVEAAREEVMVEIEEYLDNHVAKEISEQQGTQHTMLQAIVSSLSEELSKNLDDNFSRVITAFDTSLSDTTKHVELASQGLFKSVEQFDKSLQTFGENTKDFSQFNHDLRTNIQRMNVSFSDLTEQLSYFAREMDKLQGGSNKEGA